MNEFLRNVIKESGNEYASLVSDGVQAGDVEEYIDTGSYALNALLSGSIYGGLPSNKITAFAGETATGKTFFVLGIVKHFLSANPTGGVIYFESESALTKNMVEARGIDSSRMVVFPVSTIQEFAHQATRIVDKHLEDNNPAPLLVCLDSLGMLSTTKEMGDIQEGKDIKDMTRAQLIKGCFRVLTLKYGKAGVPLLVTNHTYKTMGLYASDELGGGQGLKYAASSIVLLSKRKEKDGTDVIGNIIHCKNYKSRLTVENKIIDSLVTYDKGLDRWYGMLELAEEAGVFKKISTRYETTTGLKLYGKQILNEPEKHFTEDVMKSVDKFCQKKFLYGVNITDTTEIIQELDEEINEPDKRD